MTTIISHGSAKCVGAILMFALFVSPANGMLVIFKPVDPAEVPRLIRELDDPDEAKRQQAADDLGRVEPPAKAREAIEPLVKRVQDPTCSFRVTAARSLSALEATTDQVQPAVAILVHEFKNQDAKMRKTALDTLAALRLKGGVGVETLRAGLRDSELSVQIAALKALGQSRERSAKTVTALRPFLQKTDPYLRDQALRALRQQGKLAIPLVPELTFLLSDPDGMVREAAASALGSIGPASTSAVPALIRCLKDDFVAFVLPVPPMTDTGTPVYLVRFSAAAALEEIGTPKALAAIKPLSNPKTGHLAIEDFVAR
jgi:HEAT repeat protein